MQHLEKFRDGLDKIIIPAHNYAIVMKWRVSVTLSVAACEDGVRRVPRRHRAIVCVRAQQRVGTGPPTHHPVISAGGAGGADTEARPL